MIRTIVLAAALLAASTLAWAQDHITVPSSTLSIGSIGTCTEQFKDVPALADRLGVKEGIGSGTFVLSLCDGRQYDFFALINAFLNKLEAAK